MTRKPKSRSKQQAPEPKLVPDQFPELNRQFYSSNPAEYFRRRLYMLAIYAGASDDVVRLLSEGISYEKIRVQVNLPNSTAEDKAEYQSFLITEAEVLLHHAAEALLRLYFAHVDEPPCPWLECARSRVPSEFKDEIEKFLDQSSSTSHNQIGRVFLGATPDASDTLRAPAVIGIERLLRMLSRRLLDDKDLYNSAKHGLTVIAGEASLIVGDSTGRSLFGSQGPSVSFLEKRGDDDAVRRWHVTTRWISPRQAMWLTGLTITQMASLWAIAKCRYLGAELDGVEVVNEEAIDEVLTGEFGNTHPITRSSWMLNYDDKNPLANEPQRDDTGSGEETSAVT